MKSPIGGLARRAGYAKIWRRTYPGSAPVFLDTGNFTDNPSPEGDVKTKTLVSAMAQMGYRAAGLGERDLARGYEYLDGLRKEAGFPFVSGNVLYQKTGRPVFDPHTIVTLTNKEHPDLPQKTLRVGVTSFVRYNPTFLKPAPGNDNMMLGNPLDEAKRVIPELRKQCDYLVVLASLPKDDAFLMARSVKGIDLILAAYGGITTGTDEMEGPTRIVYLGNQGKTLAEIRLLKGPQGWQTTQNIHYLGATYPEEQKMAGVVRSALNGINEANRRLAEERAVQKRALTSAAAAAAAAPTIYRGDETCGACHAREHDIWKGSRHAHAFDILVEKRADFNPECVGCHTVGFRTRGGFEDAKNTPHLIHVQCESCHGPAANHPENPTMPYGRAGGEASCKPCHTLENSPTFEFGSYWGKIKH